MSYTANCTLRCVATCLFGFIVGGLWIGFTETGVPFDVMAGFIFMGVALIIFMVAEIIFTGVR